MTMETEPLPPRNLANTLQRALSSNVVVVGEPQDLFEAGLEVLPTAWEHAVPGHGSCWSAIGQANASWVWVVRAGRFDGEQWSMVVDAFERSAAKSLVLVVVNVSGSGASLRRALESLAFAAGLRKHAGYYLMLDYEALHHDTGPLIVPLEKLPSAALEVYPLPALKEERDLHMDMLREAGERSDGHVIRYHLAAELVRPGDHVLDAACGLGYGSYVLSQSTRCASVLGVDGSDYAISYAQQNFGATDQRLSFRRGWLPDDLADLPDESFDLVISFETLEHIANPTGLLAEFHRVLRPGGRIIVSVPNDWSDESGKDPNPYHLHVYTLDTLRQQFSRHFVRERLHQQIASGCKRRSTGNSWAPLPRTLREVPVDTAMVPDSEWWVMSGSKPERAAIIDYNAPGYASQQPPWAQTAGSEHLANGLVLAMHCVPASVDSAVEAFWSRLGQQLAQRGHTLVLLSSTPVSDPSLQVIEVPYVLTAFLRQFDIEPSAAEVVSEQAIYDTVSWYGCSHDDARDSLRLARAFMRDVLDTLRPAAVLGWHWHLPITQVLRECAQSAGLPWWTAERGWVRNTLMFDLGGTHLLGEAHTSLSIDRARARYQPSPVVLEALRQRATEAASLGRYAGAARMSREALRDKLGIPPGAQVGVLFTHGEPGMNSMGTAVVREFHDLSSELLQARVEDLSRALLARGFWLLVQEHPFNAPAGRCLRLPGHERVIPVQENVSSLLDTADVCLFTLATLQFDAVFLDKPLGLLSRSALYRDGTPPFMGDFDNAEAFLDELLDATAWPARFESLRADVAFMFEHCLIDIESEAVNAGAAEWAEHLARLRRPVDVAFHHRVERFLQQWAAHA